MTDLEIDVWLLREPAPTSVDVVDFDVEAVDGRIGSVDEATWDVRSGRLVVDTGPWIFGHKVILPAGVIERIDPDGRKVFVACTRDQVKNAPAYDDENLDDHERYWRSLREYWGAPGPSGPAVAAEDRITS